MIYGRSRIATEHGFYAAKEFLGQATISTTEKHDAAYLKDVCAVSAVPMIDPLRATGVDFFTIPK